MDDFIAPGWYILTNMATRTALDLSARDNVSIFGWYVHTCWPHGRIPLNYPELADGLQEKKMDASTRHGVLWPWLRGRT